MFNVHLTLNKLFPVNIHQLKSTVSYWQTVVSKCKCWKCGHAYLSIFNFL